LEEGAVALEVELRVLEQRLVLRHLALGLRKLHLEWARVDLGEQGASLDDLPFLESDPHELAVDARLDDDDVARRDGAERVDVDVDAALARRDGHYREGAGRGIAPSTEAPAGTWRACAGHGCRRIWLPARPVPVAGAGRDERCDRNDPEPAAPPGWTRLGRGRRHGFGRCFGGGHRFRKVR